MMNLVKILIAIIVSGAICIYQYNYSISEIKYRIYIKQCDLIASISLNRLICSYLKKRIDNK